MARYQTSVASSATSLYEVEGETGKNVVAALSFKGNHPHLPNILEEMHNSLAVRLHQAYNYGRDTYTYGLPNGYTEIIGDASIAQIADAVEAEVGYPVDIEYASVSEADASFFAQYYGWLNWGWRFASSYFAYPPVSPLEGYYVRLSSANIEGNGRLRVSFNIGADNLGDYQFESVDVYDCVPTPDESKIFYHVRFTPAGSGSPDHGYFIYEVGSGLYPDLDVVDSINRNSPFLPIVPLRQDNRNMGPAIDANGDFILDVDGNKIVPNTDLYRTSKKLCKYLDTDFDDLCKAISTNPDVKDIDHAYLIMGIDIRTTHKAGKAYLYNFFQDLAIKDPGIKRIKIADAKFNIDITFDSVTFSGQTGSLSQRTELIYRGNNLTLRYDNRDGTYGQVVVTNLKHTNYIYSEHTNVITLEDSADPEEFGFIIPLNYDLYKQSKSLFDRYELIRESFKIVCNAYERKKLKWYQTGIFKVLLFAVMVVITIYSAGTFTAGLSAAYAAGGIYGAMVFAVSTVFYATAISYGFRAIARRLPPEFAMAVALIAIIVTIGYGASQGEFADAYDLLQYTSPFIEGVQEGIQDALVELNKEMKEFIDYSNLLVDELDALEEELYDTTWFEIITALDTPPTIEVRETPSEFYTRTIHAGNIGVVSLSAAENYCDNMLRLPENNQI